MASSYGASHNLFNSSYFKYKSLTNETCYQLNQRSIFDGKLLNIDDFIKHVHAQAPLKGLFYKIQKDGQTVGYLLGTMHLGNELFSNLNPKILKAISKSKIIAGEEPIDQMGKKKFVPEKNIEKKFALFSKILHHAIKKLTSHFILDLKIVSWPLLEIQQIKRN
ncbi:MAG: TraB/GumN family protein [Parachlamydiaceae bacterium]|nr:MAG: TraB/GumN family protein [Parachlamydiaceae bacterium]